MVTMTHDRRFALAEHFELFAFSKYHATIVRIGRGGAHGTIKLLAIQARAQFVDDAHYLFDLVPGECCYVIVNEQNRLIGLPAYPPHLYELALADIAALSDSVSKSY